MKKLLLSMLVCVFSMSLMTGAYALQENSVSSKFTILAAKKGKKAGAKREKLLTRKQKRKIKKQLRQLKRKFVKLRRDFNKQFKIQPEIISTIITEINVERKGVGKNVKSYKDYQDFISRYDKHTVTYTFIYDCMKDTKKSWDECHSDAIAHFYLF